MFVNVSVWLSYSSVGCSSTARLRPFGADEAVVGRRDDERRELGVDACELVPLEHLVALGGRDRPDLDGRRVCRQRLEPVLRSDVEIARRLVDEEEDELAVLGRGRRRVRLPVRRSDERHLLDGDDRLVLRQVVPRRPVGEGDVRVRDDRDQDERDEEDDARDEVLERDEPPARVEVDEVDERGRRERDQRGDPLVVGDEDARGPEHERVQEREQDDLDPEPDGAGEEPDRPHEPRGARNVALGCDGCARHGVKESSSDPWLLRPGAA